MTREEIKEFLPIMQAFAEGKAIQFRCKSGEWVEIRNDEIDFSLSPNDYRIKPNPKYRPFKTQEECWDEMLKHQSFGWIKQKENEGKIVHIGCIFEVTNQVLIVLSADEGHITTSSYLFRAYTFIDGAPFGKEE